jgi:hypothetical protein
MLPDEDRLTVEIPTEEEAAKGWLPPADEVSSKESRVAKLTDDDQDAKDEADALANLRRERDALATQLAENQQTSKAELEARDQRLASVEKVSAENRQYGLQAHWQKVNAEKDQLASGIRSCDMVIDAQEQELAAALEQGGQEGAQRAAKAQRAIARAEAEKVGLESGLAAADYEIQKARTLLEQERARVTAKPAEKKPDAEAKKPDTPTAKKSPDAWIDNIRSNVGTKVADWLSEHREFVTNPALNKQFVAAAEAFAKEGKPLSGKAFIRELDSKFFSEGDEMSDDTEEKDTKDTKEPAKQRSASPAAAPVTRDGGDYYSSKNPSGAKLKLHPRLVQAAKEINSDPEVYANTVKKMIGEGKYPKNYLDWDYQESLKR